MVVVGNIDKSRYLYESILGQAVKSDHGENVVFHGDFAIHQKSHFKHLINAPIASRSNSFELYFETDDLTVIVNKLKGSDIEFIHEIKEQPWRQQVTRFYDYDYNIIEIGEKLEHVAYRLFLENTSIDRICEITYLVPDREPPFFKKIGNLLQFVEVFYRKKI